MQIIQCIIHDPQGSLLGAARSRNARHLARAQPHGQFYQAHGQHMHCLMTMHAPMAKHARALEQAGALQWPVVHTKPRLPDRASAMPAACFSRSLKFVTAEPAMKYTHTSAKPPAPKAANTELPRSHDDTTPGQVRPASRYLMPQMYTMVVRPKPGSQPGCAACKDAQHPCKVALLVCYTRSERAAGAPTALACLCRTDIDSVAGAMTLLALLYTLLARPDGPMMSPQH